MKFALYALVLGTALATAGAASACENSSICGSGWQNRGGHGSSHGGGSGYGYGSGYGSGVGYGGAGGSAKASANNTNNVSQSLSNRNTNSNNNSSSNVANGYGGNASIAEGAVRNTNNNSQTQTQTQSQSVANSGNSNVSNAGNNTVSVAYTNIQKQQPVATAYAAPLVAGADTCMGSTSVGGQGITIGFSFASTWTDKNCVRLKNSREFNAMGMTDVACELLAMDREVAAALRRTGRGCAQQHVAFVEAPPPPPVPCCAPPPPPCCEAPPQLPIYEQERGDAYTRPVPYGERG